MFAEELGGNEDGLEEGVWEWGRGIFVAVSGWDVRC